MMIALHKRARTTPAIRAEIAASTESAKALACRFGVSEATIYKWKSRQSVQDRSHTAHRLQTTLTSAQETIVVHLRRTLLLPLDDLLAVTREFLCPDVSRSGLDRCLRRHGVGNLHALKPATPQEPHKAFKSYEPGYLHMDVKYLPQMQDETKRRYLFVAIDRATRWVFVAIKKDKTAASAGSFLKALHKACPLKIVKLLTDNGKEFTDRLFASRERAPSGNHEFDQLCQELGIEHRLTRPRTPKTNGMVERFNGRISDVLKTNRFNSALDLEETLLRYVALYNHQLPQSALQSKTPMQAMKGWYDSQPSLFHKRPYDRPGCDSYRQGHVGHQHVGHGSDEGHRHQVLVVVITQLEQVRRNGVGGGHAHYKGVAVGGLGGHVGGQGVGRAGAVFHHHTLLEQRAQAVGHSAGHGVGTAAGGRAHQQLHGLARPFLGGGGGHGGAQRGRQAAGNGKVREGFHGFVSCLSESGWEATGTDARLAIDF